MYRRATPLGFVNYEITIDMTELRTLGAHRAVPATKVTSKSEKLFNNKDQPDQY